MMGVIQKDEIDWKEFKLEIPVCSTTLGISKDLRLPQLRCKYRQFTESTEKLEPDGLLFFPSVILTESFEVLRITGLHLCLVQDAQESAGHFHHFVDVLEHYIQIGQWGLEGLERLLCTALSHSAVKL